MSRDLLSFRTFMELVQASPNYTDKLNSELGIDSDSASTNPQWLANATLGNVSYNGMTYQFQYVKNGQGEVTGALVKPMDTQRVFMKDKDGRQVQKPGASPDEGKQFFVSKDQINKMLTQGQDQQQQPGGMGGMPPGGGGMPPMGM
jgi:hypothetical protein